MMKTVVRRDINLGDGKHETLRRYRFHINMVIEDFRDLTKEEKKEMGGRKVACQTY